MDFIQDCKFNKGNEDCGIYTLTHELTGMIYIGRTTRLSERFKEHCRALRNNKHSNQLLQKDYNLYNRLDELLKFDIIVRCPEYLLNNLETFFIRNYKSEILYNNSEKAYGKYSQILKYINDEKKWLNKLKPRYQIILQSYIDWYFDFYESDFDIRNSLIDELLNEGMNEAKDGSFMDEHKVLKENFHQKNNFFDNMLDYIALAMIKKIYKNEKNEKIFEEPYTLYKNNNIFKNGLVDRIILTMKENSNEFPDILLSCYKVGVSIEKYHNYYDNKLDYITVLKDTIKFNNLLDCLFAYTIIVYLIGVRNRK